MKNTLRKTYRRIRNDFSHGQSKQRSTSNLCLQIQAAVARFQPTQIFTYMPHRSEPDFSHIYPQWHMNQIKVAVPVIQDKKQMDFFLITPETTFTRNSFNILEPNTPQAALVPDATTLILVPALAIDRSGYRLGYGGGYYDCYLQKHPQGLHLGVVWSTSMTESLPHDPWDVPIHGYITEQQTVYLKC